MERTGIRRGYFSSRRPRWKYPLYKKSVFSKRPLTVRRSLFNSRPVPEKLKLQSIHENQYGPTFTIPNNGSTTSYITYPSIGILEPNRQRSFIKLNRLRFNRTATIQSTQTDVVMDPHSPTPIARLNGVLSLVIVLDRKPHIVPGTNELDRFEEVFGVTNFSHGNLQVLARHRDRYRIKHTFKRVISVEKESTFIKVGGLAGLSSARYPCWAGFKDLDLDNLGGNYGNQTKNAFLVFYCWMSDSPSRANMFVSFDIDYLR
ncbi:hypothetical protein V6N13_083256 [Hibiscus sabdariffa]|uniref:Nuclear shuttle protein n=1 Tax=Hibiscus sabdariffa TaxID=183260 RepID=A0ABR2SXS8_9ROSI